MFTNFTKTVGIGSYGMNKMACQSALKLKPEFLNSIIADRPQTVDAVWARSGTHTPAVGPLVRSRGPQGRHGADTRPSLHLLSFSLPLCTPSGKTEPLLCRALRRHRARSPSHHFWPDHVHGATTFPSTSSSPLSSKLNQGKGLLADSAAAAMGSTSPELGRSMARVARALLDLPFLPC
jgi:hypothetical protein